MTRGDIKMNEFLQRLKERKLVQWTVAYVASGFRARFSASTLSRSALAGPNIRAVHLHRAGVGFFVTLVLAWYHGERGAQRVTGTELLILALLLAVGGGFLWRFAGAAHERIVRSDARACCDRVIACTRCDSGKIDRGPAF